MLAIRGLRYAWPGAGADCLRIDRLDVAAGRAVFLHGPSGCGKSTLLGLMAGVLVAGAGQVVLLGQDWAALRGGQRDRQHHQPQRAGEGAALGQRQRLALAVGKAREIVGRGAQHRMAAVRIAQRDRHRPGHRTVHVSLQAIEAIHLDWAGGAPLPGVGIAPENARKFDLEPKQVTALLVGLRNRAAVFNVQRFVADYEAEPLLAVLPGVALDELWEVVGIGERALLLMSALVALVSLASLVAVVLAGLNERRCELAVLRAVGAGPRHVLALLAVEGALVTLSGALLGAAAAALAVLAAGPWLQQRFGIALQAAAPTPEQWALFGTVLLAGMLAALVPGWRAYRLSLADGLSPRT